MKKMVKIAVVVFLCTMMCGCLETPPLTDEEMDIVAEYAAELLLKYDKNYRSSLLSEEELEQAAPEVTKAPEATKIPDAPTDGPENTASVTPSPTQSAESLKVTPIPGNAEETTAQLTKVTAVEGIRVSCDSYDVRKEVIENEYFFLEAKSGKEYLILHFRLENITDQLIVFDASEQKLECSLDINTGSIYKRSISMLENDLQYMPIEVPAGETVDAVLVFEITSTEKVPIETANFIMMNKNDEAVFVKVK